MPLGSTRGGPNGRGACTSRSGRRPQRRANEKPARAATSLALIAWCRRRSPPPDAADDFLLNRKKVMPRRPPPGRFSSIEYGHTGPCARDRVCHNPEHCHCCTLDPGDEHRDDLRELNCPGPPPSRVRGRVARTHHSPFATHQTYPHPHLPPHTPSQLSSSNGAWSTAPPCGESAVCGEAGRRASASATQVSLPPAPSAGDGARQGGSNRPTVIR